MNHSRDSRVLITENEASKFRRLKGIAEYGEIDFTEFWESNHELSIKRLITFIREPKVAWLFNTQI